MTVAELIEKLKAMPQDARVGVLQPCYGDTEISEVDEVQQREGYVRIYGDGPTIE